MSASTEAQSVIHRRGNPPAAWMSPPRWTETRSPSRPRLRNGFAPSPSRSNTTPRVDRSAIAARTARDTILGLGRRRAGRLSVALSRPHSRAGGLAAIGLVVPLAAASGSLVATLLAGGVMSVGSLLGLLAAAALGAALSIRVIGDRRWSEGGDGSASSRPAAWAQADRWSGPAGDPARRGPARSFRSDARRARPRGSRPNGDCDAGRHPGIGPCEHHGRADPVSVARRTSPIASPSRTNRHGGRDRAGEPCVTCAHVASSLC